MANIRQGAALDYQGSAIKNEYKYLMKPRMADAKEPSRGVAPRLARSAINGFERFCKIAHCAFLPSQPR